MNRRSFLAALGAIAGLVGTLAAQDREPLNYIYDNDLRHNFVTDNFVTENEMTGRRRVSGQDREPLNFMYDNDLRHNFVTENEITENEITGWTHTSGSYQRHASGSYPRHASPVTRTRYDPIRNQAERQAVRMPVEVPKIDIFEPGAYRKLDRTWLNWATKK